MKIILINEILIKKVMMKKILMKKIVRKKDKKYNFMFFFLYIKMVNKYYIKKGKKNFEKKHVKDIKIFLKQKKKKSASIIVNVIRIFLKKKGKRKLRIWEKSLFSIIKTIFKFFLEFCKVVGNGGYQGQTSKKKK